MDRLMDLPAGFRFAKRALARPPGHKQRHAGRPPGPQPIHTPGSAGKRCAFPTPSPVQSWHQQLDSLMKIGTAALRWPLQFRHLPGKKPKLGVLRTYDACLLNTFDVDTRMQREPDPARKPAMRRWAASSDAVVVEQRKIIHIADVLPWPAFPSRMI